MRWTRRGGLEDVFPALCARSDPLRPAEPIADLGQDGRSQWPVWCVGPVPAHRSGPRPLLRLGARRPGGGAPRFRGGGSGGPGLRAAGVREPGVPQPLSLSDTLSSPLPLSRPGPRCEAGSRRPGRAAVSDRPPSPWACLPAAATPQPSEPHPRGGRRILRWKSSGSVPLSPPALPWTLESGVARGGQGVCVGGWERRGWDALPEDAGSPASWGSPLQLQQLFCSPTQFRALQIASQAFPMPMTTSWRPQHAYATGPSFWGAMPFGNERFKGNQPLTLVPLHTETANQETKSPHRFPGVRPYLRLVNWKKTQA